MDCQTFTMVQKSLLLVILIVTFNSKYVFIESLNDDDESWDHDEIPEVNLEELVSELSSKISWFKYAGDVTLSCARRARNEDTLMSGVQTLHDCLEDNYKKCASEYAVQSGCRHTVHYKAPCGHFRMGVPTPLNQMLYKSNLKCYWLVEVPKPFVVNMTFDEFHLEYSGPECLYDYMTVYDGGVVRNKDFGRFCGRLPAFSLYGSSNKMIIHAYTDGSVGKTGFRGIFQVMDKGYGQTISRPVIMTEEDGEITLQKLTPVLFYKTYNYEETVFYYEYKVHIRAKYGSKIRLSVEYHLDTNSSISILDGNVKTKWKLSNATYSNLTTETKENMYFESSTFLLTLQIHRPELIDETSLIASYTMEPISNIQSLHSHQCTGKSSIHVTSAEGKRWISLPSSSNLLENEPIHCIWNITTDPNYFIRLEIDYQPNGPNIDHCLYEGFVVVNGNDFSSDHNIIGPFCSDEPAGLFTLKDSGITSITSSSNSLVVMFYTFMQYPSSTSAKRGHFKAMLESTPCKGIIDPCSLPLNSSDDDLYRVHAVPESNNSVNVDLYCQKSKCCVFQQFPIQKAMPYHLCNVTVRTEGSELIATSLIEVHTASSQKNDSHMAYSCQLRDRKRMLSDNFTLSRQTCLGNIAFFEYQSTSPWEIGAFIISVKPNKCGFIKLGIHDSNKLYPPCAHAVVPYANSNYSVEFIDPFYVEDRYFAITYNVKDTTCNQTCLQDQLQISDGTSYYIWDTMPYLPYTWYSWSSSTETWRRKIKIFRKIHKNCTDESIKNSCELHLDFKEHYLVPVSSDENLTCPEDYTLVWKSCYKIPELTNHTNLQSLSMSHNDAMKMCQRDGGILVSINSKQEMTYIKQYAFRKLWKRFLQYTSGIKVLFVGLKYYEQNNTLRWLTGQPLTYMEWSIPDYNNHRPSSFRFVQDNTTQPFVMSNYIREQLKQLQPSVTQGYNCVAMVIDDVLSKVQWVKIPCDSNIDGVLPLCEVSPTNHSLPSKASDDVHMIMAPKNYSTTIIKHGKNYSLDVSKFYCLYPFVMFRSRCIAIYSLKANEYVKSGFGEEQCRIGSKYNELLEEQTEDDPRFEIRPISPREASFNREDISLLKLMIPALMHQEQSGKIRIRLKENQNTDCYVLYPVRKQHTFNNDSVTVWELTSLELPDKNGKLSCSHVNNKPKLHQNLTSFICEIDPVEYKSSCEAHHFKCRNDMCILIHNVCDGTPDCLDNSDEEECIDICISTTNITITTSSCFTEACHPVNCTCSKRYFQCETGRCIPVSKVCNHLSDCPDGSDEMACNSDVCDEKTSFACKNGECIASDKRCDFIKDCLDGSDEKDCGILKNCQDKKRFFSCQDGTCIPRHAVNDFIPDCPQRTLSNLFKFADDEKKISKLHQSLQLQVKNAYRKNKKLKPVNECVGIETSCSPWIKKCFPKNVSCIYDRDRENNIRYCRNAAHLQQCEARQCGHMFKCPRSYCIPIHRVCDGHFDCINGEDEAECDNFHCRRMFKCKNENHCIHQSEVCNGEVNCHLSREDEEMCDYRQKGCPDFCTCYGHYAECKGTESDHFRKDKKSFLNKLDFKNVKALILRNNGLKKIPEEIKKFIRLHRFDLSHNKISSFEEYFDEMKGLVELHITHNRITSITKQYFKKLNHLKILKLNDNLISHMLAECFIGLKSLPELDLSYQQLRSIQSFHFAGLKSIKKLNLSGNVIDSIENNSFSDKTENDQVTSLKTLEYLDISKNPLTLTETQPFSMLPQGLSLLSDRHKFCCFSRHIKACYPGPDEFSSCEEMISNKVLRTLIWGTGVLAFIGNLVILQQRLKHERETSPSLLVHHLSFSDLLMGTYLLIVAGADQYFKHEYMNHADYWHSHALCKVAGFLSMMSCEMSSFIMMLITIDRIFACVPICGGQSLSIRTTKGLIAVGWTTSAILSLIPVLEFPYFGGDGFVRSGVCTTFNVIKGMVNGWEYSMAVYIVLNTVIYLVCGVGYVIVCVKVCQGVDVWDMYLPDDLDDEQKKIARNIIKNEFTIARRLFLCVFTNFVVWIPLIAVSLMTFLGYRLSETMSAWIALFIMPLNAAINPYLYTFSTKPYRILEDDLLANWVEENDENFIEEADEEIKGDTDMAIPSMTASVYDTRTNVTNSSVVCSKVTRDVMLNQL